jgi:hypothetical protein
LPKRSLLGSSGILEVSRYLKEREVVIQKPLLGFIGGILGQLCEPWTKPRLDYARVENVPKWTKDGLLQRGKSWSFHKSTKDGNIYEVSSQTLSQTFSLR